MTMTDHDRWADAAGAYVLGAMTATERDEFELHLATCPACREDVDELRPAAEALPMASPPVLPPPALKDRIMAEVEREAALLAQAGPAADRPAPAAERPRRRFRLPALTGWRLAPVAAALLYLATYAGAIAVAVPAGPVLTMAGGLLFGRWLGMALATISPERTS